MQTNHTPGPWHVTGDEHGTMITDNTGEQIALWPQQGGTVEQCANAALIAAAPDLLAALRQIEAATVDGGTVNTIARAAIARATGPTDDQFMAALGPCGK